MGEKLETRKMLAEFAGWECVQVDDVSEPPELDGISPFLPKSSLDDVPHYESDPAAACSLLPKLCVVFAGIDPQVDSERESYFADFWIPLWEALTEERDEDACALIANAVREVARA